MSRVERFGLSAALTMPFDAALAIDLRAAIDHAKSCLQRGCSSVTLFGTTGEGSSIGALERQAVIKEFIAAGIEPSQIVVGIMANSHVDAAEQARFALDAGCRGILLAPPSYFKNVSDDGLFDWHSATFRAVGPDVRGVILYNLPSVTAVEISIDLVTRLREAFPNAIAGVKDSSGNWNYTEKMLARHNDLAILIGDERSLAGGVRLGGQGAISGLANLYPERLLRMIDEGRDDEEVVAAVNELVKYPVIPAVKAMVAHHRGEDGWRRTRGPLEALPEGDFKHLTTIFDRLFVAAAA
ncbi:MULTISPECIES: dihydrodipicolinate synthase family protein [unclassified Phyllobacterium]|uniref:dihydrodipicolinate synthase family protein n=1 Tax=Phyllobacterium sp. P30BS-XVII TaxID=2587046 RepID=UPI0015F810FA|nr:MULTISPECIES: dihydrodipicolinate synthase family protein [unclassified Phyllobacterium]MBA8903403.1 4-hydroxy-tetrahydrodipicolinate synthase [Phyllobacterium sp. P30BS-XVII]UGX88261.1 dihydrodipicolinate synthase family protein [Phyllobacterium sp. T1293]